MPVLTGRVPWILLKPWWGRITLTEFSQGPGKMSATFLRRFMPFSRYEYIGVKSKEFWRVGAEIRSKQVGKPEAGPFRYGNVLCTSFIIIYYWSVRLAH